MDPLVLAWLGAAVLVGVAGTLAFIMRMRHKRSARGTRAGRPRDGRTKRMHSKEISTSALLALVPDLSQIDIRITDGVLRDAVVRADWAGEWSGSVQRWIDIRAHDGADLSGESSHGMVTLKKARVRSQQFTGEVAGVSVAVQLRGRTALAPGEVVYRCFVKVRPDLVTWVTFPAWLEDKQAGSGAVAYLPLTVNSYPIDIFFLKEGPYLILESRDQRLDLARFREIATAARVLLSYVTGQRFDAESCDVVAAASSGQLIESHWHAGRDRRKHIYSVIPCGWGEWVAAQKKLKLPQGARPLDPVVLSACLETFLQKPALITPIEYLLSFPDAPVEMRGALLSVALESLTDQMQGEGLIKAAKPLDDEQWKLLRADLEKVIETHGAAWSGDQKSIFRNRLLNANSPTNRDKLTQPFALFGIALAEPEIDAISERNKFLHEGRILDPNAVKDDPEAWREAYLVEMRLFTAINKLMLKYLKYSGPVIDWGERGFDADKESYVLLAAEQPAPPPGASAP